MPLVTFYHEAHQPFRLSPSSDPNKFLWDKMNREVYQKVAKKCYIPATKMLTQVIKDNPEFRVCLSFSGTLIEQSKMYKKDDSGKNVYDIIPLLQGLYEAGKTTNPDGKQVRRVEYLDETSHHSLAGLFEDPEKAEFRKQIEMHSDMMIKLFGEKPTSFRNTELMYNNEIAKIVSELGYKAILCEQRTDMFTPRDGKKISSDAIFRAKDTNLIVIPRNRELSDDVAYRFNDNPITTETYAHWISNISGESVMMGYDYEHIGEHVWEDKGIFEFWKHLPQALRKYKNIELANPTEIAEKFEHANCPVVDIDPFSTSSWADTMRDIKGWVGNPVQVKLLKEIENMEKPVKEANGDLEKMWRYLTTSDTLYYLYQGVNTGNFEGVPKDD